MRPLRHPTNNRSVSVLGGQGWLKPSDLGLATGALFASCTGRLHLWPSMWAAGRSGSSSAAGRREPSRRGVQRAAPTFSSHRDGGTKPCPDGVGNCLGRARFVSQDGPGGSRKTALLIMAPLLLAGALVHLGRPGGAGTASADPSFAVDGRWSVVRTKVPSLFGARSVVRHP